MWECGNSEGSEGKQAEWNRESNGSAWQVFRGSSHENSDILNQAVFTCFVACLGKYSHSVYFTSPSMWDHTQCLPATRHKLTRPALTPARQATTPVGWKAELT